MADASRLGALLGTLQSGELLFESLSEQLLGGSGAWTVATLLEAWKTLCRLRLLLLHSQQQALSSEPVRLLRSLAPDGRPEAEQWVSAVRSVGGSSRLRERAALADGRWAAAAEALSPPGASLPRRAPSAVLAGVGELLHVLQPLAYLLLLVSLGRGRAGASGGGPLRRRLPWLVALALEGGALALCAEAVKRASRREPGGAAAASRTSSCSLASDANELELRHRRMLVLLLLLRPAARVATRAALARLAARAAGSPGRGLLGGWCAFALELVDSLEASPAFRYFR